MGMSDVDIDAILEGDDLDAIVALVESLSGRLEQLEARLFGPPARPKLTVVEGDCRG